MWRKTRGRDEDVVNPVQGLEVKCPVVIGFDRAFCVYAPFIEKTDCCVVNGCAPRVFYNAGDGCTGVAGAIRQCGRQR